MAKLLILSDYGLDDAVATAHILEHRQMFDSIDVLAVAGNTSADNSLYNARVLLSNLTENSENLRIVDTCAFEQAWTHLPSIHGNDGMGDLLKLKKETVPVISYDVFMSEQLGDCIMLSLGPLTVTVDILEKKGAMPLIIMAGLTKAEPNFKGYEFNHELDKPAFEKAVKYPHVIATLDTCRDKRFNMVNRKGEASGVKGMLIARAIELAVKRHPDNCYIYDYVAAQYLTDKESFTTRIAVDPWGNALTELKAV